MAAIISDKRKVAIASLKFVYLEIKMELAISRASVAYNEVTEPKFERIMKDFGITQFLFLKDQEVCLSLPIS